MSLVGSLGDLGLVDILQIVSLSRKTGVLKLLAEKGAGQILLSDGLVQGASIKGEAQDLRSLLVGKGAVSDEDFERAEAESGGDANALVEFLGQSGVLDSERFESLKREHVERAVMRMFGWRKGEFSFEICQSVGDEDAEMLLPAGLNTQYLAMEATRLGDEGGRTEVLDPGEDEDFELSGEESSVNEAVPEAEILSEPGDSDGETVEATAADLFGALEESNPTDALVLASLRRAGGAEVKVSGPADGSGALPVEVESRVTEEASASSPVESAQAGSGGSSAELPSCQLIVVDADLSGLEWFKAAVDGVFRHVHIFQRSELAVQRIRQYLVRGEVPMIVLAEALQREGNEARDLMRRLRSLAPSMQILTLRTDKAQGDPPPGTDGVVVRPASPTADTDRWHLYQSFADALRDDLEQRVRSR